jgi:predicted RNase H-like HicB family nuclease
MNNQRILRCYAKKEQSHWVAVCIDLSLAAQADSPKEAIEKLEAMIKTYVDEALTIHKDYADQLLTRKAPLSQLITYYHALCLGYLNKICHKSNNNDDSERAFFENYPIQTV